MKMVYRQGDVLLMRVENIPAGAEEQPAKDRIVLAYGEVTGHAHAIQATEARIYSFQAERFLRVAQEAFLRHEEHAEIKLPAGDYQVIQQREYTPEGLRNVKDENHSTPRLCWRGNNQRREIRSR
jgi:class 3 adenylate cyclase